MRTITAVLAGFLLTQSLPVKAQGQQTYYQIPQTSTRRSSSQQGQSGYAQQGQRGYAQKGQSGYAQGQHGSTQSQSAPTAARKSYDFADTINSGGNQRTFRVHVPPTYDRSKPIPVVMVFHGLGGTGGLMQALTQFNVYADKKNFVVIYPDGLGHRWDDGAHANSGDPKFISDMISKLSSIINIDRRHLYAVGYSNGGHFVMYLACVTTWLNAIGIIGSSMMTGAASQCSSTRTPAMFFIGTADPLVPSDDAQHNATLGKLGDAVGLAGLGTLSTGMAKMGGLMSAEETVEFWARKNGSSTSPYTTQMPDNSRDNTKVIRETFGGYGSEVVYYKIQNGGHTWPGAIYNGPGDIVGNVSQDVDATELLTDFFMKH